MQRPLPGEYLPYFQQYIDLVAEGHFPEVMQQNTQDTLRFFREMPEEKHNYSYAPGKWTIKDVLMHLADMERGLAFRAFIAARGHSTMPLFAMDENLYAANTDLTHRPLASIIDEFAAIRQATTLLLLYTPHEKTLWTCNVAANTVTVRALTYIIIGHAQHHMRIVRERYL